VVKKEKDDLVAFLRNPLAYPPRMTMEVFNEAADEIERLRELLVSWTVPTHRHSNSPPSDGSKE
jgi:hypothetical protein